jgi:hypothetical protein
MTLHYNMHNETLFLAIFYMDRFMTIRTGVERAYLQLIAIACLMIAAKIEVQYASQWSFRKYILQRSLITQRLAKIDIGCRILPKPN